VSTGSAMVRSAGLAALLVLSVEDGPAPRAQDAAGISVSLAAAPGEITVGDPVALKLTVTHPAGAVCVMPDLTALKATGQASQGLTVEQVEPRESMESMPSAPAAGVQAVETAWIIRVRPFAPGDMTIEGVEVTCSTPGSSTPHAAASQPLTLRVASVLKDPGEEASDIKGPWRLPRSWWLALATLAILLAAGVVAWRIWRRLRRRAPVPIAAPPPAAAPSEHPYHRALRDLERLLSSSLLAQGRIKDFHVLLSEIVKRFLGSLHGFDALDRTTEEVLAEMKKLAIGAELKERTLRFLHACDMVKFARHHPEAAEIDATVAAARALIESGRPRHQEKAA